MAKGIVKTAKGVYLDMNRLSRDNPNEIAMTAGGLSMNARGDILGKGGRVIKTREAFERAYNAANEKATKHVLSTPVSIKKTNISPDNLPKEETKRVINSSKKIDAIPTEKDFTLEEVSESMARSTKSTKKDDVVKRKRKTTTDEE